VTLLSALSDVPLRQDIAITGAVDQRGQIMAVGGINEKVEGFWRACRSRGLVGTQGVAIPRANVDALQVAPALVDDVEAGRFHVYAVETVQELMDLLCEEPFGTLDAAGVWTEGSLGARIARRLEEMAEVMRGFGGGNH
jgi:predicted ATP-dependent protease